MTALLWVLVVMLGFVLFALFGFAVQQSGGTAAEHTQRAVTIRSLGVTSVGLSLSVVAVAIAGAVIGS